MCVGVVAREDHLREKRRTNFAAGERKKQSKILGGPEEGWSHRKKRFSGRAVLGRTVLGKGGPGKGGPGKGGPGHRT